MLASSLRVTEFASLSARTHTDCTVCSSRLPLHAHRLYSLQFKSPSARTQTVQPAVQVSLCCLSTILPQHAHRMHCLKYQTPSVRTQNALPEVPDYLSTHTECTACSSRLCTHTECAACSTRLPQHAHRLCCLQFKTPLARTDCTACSSSLPLHAHRLCCLQFKTNTYMHFQSVWAVVLHGCGIDP
jgi:hypothetical protein